MVAISTGFYSIEIQTINIMKFNSHRRANSECRLRILPHHFIVIIMASLYLLLFTVGAIARDGHAVVRQCEPIRIEACRNFGYNVTGTPNLLGQTSQTDAQLQFNTFGPLVQYKCAAQLSLFLCLVHVPMCTEKVVDLIGPCRSVCEKVRATCEPVLNNFGFVWLASFNCSRFPPKNEEPYMCMDGTHIFPETSEETPLQGVTPLPRTPSDKLKPGMKEDEFEGRRVAPNPCNRTHRHPEKYVYLQSDSKCALLCNQHDVFSEEDKQVAEIWIKISAILCFIFTLFTLLTFAINSKRFRYPERSIVWLSACYWLCSVAYIVRIIAGREAASCVPYSEVLNSGSEGSPIQTSILILEGYQNIYCVAIFLLLYYFGSAGALWWAILTFTWFLAASLKWSHEAIEQRSTYFHLIVWTLSFIQTVIILVTRAMDADELTGMCSVGNQNSANLLYFVVVPLCLCLVIGTVFLLSGFVAIFRIRRQVRNNGERTDSLEKLMVRIGIYCFFYLIPAVYVVGSHLYEYANMERWYRVGYSDRPAVGVLLLKIFMSLTVGITSGLWICGSKTLKSWENFCRDLCGRLTSTGNATKHQPEVQQNFIHKGSSSSRAEYWRPKNANDHQQKEPKQEYRMQGTIL